jgi:Txe/YoeB family toxin of Txe-Axe toxin-antitoxin module
MIIVKSENMFGINLVKRSGESRSNNYKEVLKEIGEFPFAGFIPEEALSLGLQGIRERLVGQTRVSYEVGEQDVYVSMFVSTRRDFMTMLTDPAAKK